MAGRNCWWIGAGVLLWVVVAGCSDDDGQVPCDGDHDCAADQLCVDGYCEAADNTGFNPGENPVVRQPILHTESEMNFLVSDPEHSEWLPLEIANGGNAILEIDDLKLEPDSHFELTFPDGRNEDGNIPPPNGDDTSFSPTQIEPGDPPLLVRVWFHPQNEQSRSEQLVISTNDPERQEHAVKLRGNHAISCLEISHRDGVDFQSVPVGESVSRTVHLRNCSTITDLELLGLSLTDSADGVFAIDDESYPGDLPGETLTMDPMETQSFVIEYTPPQQGSYDGEFLVTSTDEDDFERRVPITGQAVEGQCPEARIGASTEGSAPEPIDDEILEVEPQDTVHLSAEESHDPAGGELSYEWALLEAPYHTDARFEPSATIADPDIWLDLSGRYVVELTVSSEDGVANCQRQTLTIDAEPDRDVYVELEWFVSGVPEPEGGEGVDLDLHYLHQNGNWGSTDWSVFAEAQHQSWADGEATMLLEEGWGRVPEVIVHDDPEEGMTYDVGVHYQWDLGFGTSFATVTVYLDGQLTWRREDQTIHTPNDLWHAGYVDWSESPSFVEVDEMVDEHSLTYGDVPN